MGNVQSFVGQEGARWPYAVDDVWPGLPRG